MKDSLCGELSIIGMHGCEPFVSEVNDWLRKWRADEGKATYLVSADCPRFGSGEAKGVIHQSVRGNDLYIVADVLGHRDVNTTKRHYAAITEDNRRRVANAVKLRDNPEDK